MVSAIFVATVLGDCLDSGLKHELVKEGFPVERAVYVCSKISGACKVSLSFSLTSHCVSPASLQMEASNQIKKRKSMFAQCMTNGAYTPSDNVSIVAVGPAEEKSKTGLWTVSRGDVVFEVRSFFTH